MSTLYQEQGEKSSPAPAFYAVIPASVRYDDQIPATAKLLYGEISALAGRDGYCWARNAYFAELYKISERTVTRLIRALEGRGYIAVREIVNPMTGQTTGRRIRLPVVVEVRDGGDKNVTPLGQNCPDPLTILSGPTILKNNTSNNSESVSETIPKKDPAELNRQVNDWVLESLRFSRTAMQKQVVEKITEFMQHRREMKHPFTKKGMTQFLNKLNQLTAGNPEAMISLMDEAMERGWRTVFPQSDAGRKPAPAAKEERTWL